METPFAMSLRTDDDGLFVRVEGELDMLTAEQLRVLADGLAGRRWQRIHIDVSAVTFIDSIGIRALVHLLREAGRTGLPIGFRISPQIERVLRTLRMDRMFPRAA